MKVTGHPGLLAVVLVEKYVMLVLAYSVIFIQILYRVPKQGTDTVLAPSHFNKLMTRTVPTPTHISTKATSANFKSVQVGLTMKLHPYSYFSFY